MTFLCDAFEANGTIARYVAGTLDDRHAAEFENHYVTCERCQDSLKAGVAVRAAAQPAVKERRFAWRTTALLAAAASLAIFAALRGYQYRTLRSWGDVDAAPLYVGSAVRGGGDAATFDSAMAAYTRADYATAAHTLEQISQNSQPQPVVIFFLGASRLMLHDARAAEASFTDVLQRGATIYQPESYFYRAKARLQRGQRTGALSDLHAAAASDNPIALDARALLKQLEN